MNLININNINIANGSTDFTPLMLLNYACFVLGGYDAYRTVQSAQGQTSGKIINANYVSFH